MLVIKGFQLLLRMWNHCFKIRIWSTFVLFLHYSSRKGLFSMHSCRFKCNVSVWVVATQYENLNIVRVLPFNVVFLMGSSGGSPGGSFWAIWWGICAFFRYCPRCFFAWFGSSPAPLPSPFFFSAFFLNYFKEAITQIQKNTVFGCRPGGVWGGWMGLRGSQRAQPAQPAS